MTAQTILPANSVVDTGFATNSCRFDGSTSYMHKTPGSAGNTKLWTWSAWIKKSLPDGADLGIFGQYIDANNFFRIRYRSDQRLQVDNYTSGSATFSVILGSDNEHRDISAWYHLVVAYDSAQGTDSNRVKIYVNGVLQTVFQAATYPNQNVVTTLPVDGTRIELGRTTDNQFFNGYMAEVVLIDGTALAPTSFGESDSDSGIWVPIDVSGLTFGTNGFYLDFKNSANLGNDANGGTDLTESNLAATDQSTDTCTNNFATMNPLTQSEPGNSPTFAENNLKITMANFDTESVMATMGVKKGKWYWEVKGGWKTSNWGFGIEKASSSNVGFSVGYTTTSYSFSQNGYKQNASSASQIDSGLSDGDIIGYALDLDNGHFNFSQNGVWYNGSATESTTFNTSTHDFTSLDFGSEFVMPTISGFGDSAITTEINFGNPSFAISSGNADANDHGNFEYEVPSGYFALCTKNIAEYGG